METRSPGWDIHDALRMVLAFIAGIFSGLLLHEYMKKRKQKRGDGKRTTRRR